MTYDFSAKKIPVFPGINDVPIVPTASRKGNGSDVISRVNGLIDEVQTAINAVAIASDTSGNDAVIYPTTLHEVYGSIFVNSLTGNDATGTGASATPYATINKGLNELKKKRINGNFELYIDGTFTEPLNFEGIYALDPQNTEYPKLDVYIGDSSTTIINITPTSLINFGSNKNLIISIQGGTLHLNTAIYAINTRVDIKTLITHDVVDFAYFNFIDSVVKLQDVVLNGTAANTKFFYGFNTNVVADGLTITDVANDVFRLAGNSRLTLESSVSGTGNTRSINISDNTVADLGLYSFASGTEIISDPAYVIRGNTKKANNLRTYELMIETPVIKSYTVVLTNPYAGRIKEISWKTETGTATAEVRSNTTLVPLASSQISNIKSSQNPTTKFLVSGDAQTIKFNVLSVDAASDIQLSIIIEAY